MPRLPQPAALWVGYNLFRLIAVVFMLWCLITQFISLADEIKMLNQLATLQGNATTLPIRLNSTAPNLSSTNLTTNTTHKSSSTGTGEKSKSSSSTSTSSQAEYSTAYSEISVTSATTLRRISTIPPSPEPTGGTSASSSDVSSGSGGSTGPALGLGTGDTGSSGGSASSSDVAGSSVGGGTSLLEGSGGSGSPLVGRGETLKRRGRWLVRGQNGEVAAVGTLRQGVHPVEGGMTQGIDKEGGLNKRADVDGEDAKGDKKAKESGNASGNATAVDTGGVIGPWRPEVPAFAAISRLCLAALLGLLVLAQVGVPEVWLHDNVASIGPQCTPLVLGCVQLFVAIETLRAPGKAHNLIGAWGVLLISILNILSGIFLWYRARPLPRDPPPALWFSHSVRLLYFRSLPAFYAPLFRVHPSVGDDDAEWVEAESQLEGVNELVGLDKRIEDEETAQNTRVNAGNGGYAGGMTDADMGLAAKIATEGRGDGPAALGASQHAQPSVEQTSKSKSRSKTSRSNGYNTKIKGQPASTDLLSDIALGPTSQRSPGILGTNTLNPHLEDLPSHSNAAQYPSTTPGSRYDADPAIHADVRQGGYPTFTGAGIAQAGRQIPAGQVRVDSRTGDVVAFDLEEEWHGKGEGGAGGGGERGEGGKEELAVVKLAERVSVYASAITGAEVLSVPHSRNGEMAHQSKSSLEREGRGRTGKDNSDRSSRSRDRDRKGERERKLPDPPGQPGVERPETVHSLLPPVNPHKPGRSRELPDSKVSPARRIPTDGIGIAGSAALTSVSVNGSGRSGHRRTPSIGKQSLAADASHRISDPSNLDTMKRNPNPAYAHDTRPEGQDGELHRPGLMFSHSSSSVESGYSGLAYDRPSKRPNHPSIQLPEPSPLTPSLGQSRDKSTGTRSTPRTPRTPKTPLLTPSPTPLTPAHVSRAQTGTVRPVSQFHFPSASASLASDQSAAEKSRGKRGTMIGKGFVRPRELDMSDDELDLVQGQLGEGESSRVGYGRGEMRRRVSSLEEEIRDLLSPPLRSQSSLAGKDGHVGHGPDERTCIGAEQTERKRAMRKSILPPGSLTQHIQAIEQQQQQQQKRLEQLSAGGLSVTPASTTSTDSAPATFPGADPDRPPSALKGSVSNSLTPPRNRPARQLRFALSPIPDTPTPVGAGQDHASSGKEGSESVSASVLGAVAGKVKQKASGKTKSSSSTKPSSRERDREAGRGKEEVPSSGSSSSQAKSTSSTASKSKARSANKTSDAPGDSAVKEGAEPTESASYTIAALGMTLALPAGLVGGITTPLSSTRGSGGGMSSAPPGKTEFEHREHRERRRGDDGGGGGGRGKEREREEKRRDRRMRRGSVQV